MGNTFSHPSLPAPSAWSDSQLDICLDQLGTAEGVVHDQEVELAVLRAALMALSSPWVIVGLAAGFSLLAVFEVARLIWYLCTGHVDNSFPLDRFCGWFLRRFWRVIRFPFVVLAEQLFGRRAAEGVRNHIDQLAVSPVQADLPPPYAIREGQQRAVPVFQPYQPRPAVVGRDMEDAESAASSISIPPPPPPLSASTIYHSAREAPQEHRTAADIRASAASLQLLRRLLEPKTVGKSLDGQATRAALALPPSPSSSSAPAAVLTSPQAVNITRWSARSEVSTGTLNFFYFSP
jgi:hypothetical protein